jgi:TonB family protein
VSATTGLRKALALSTAGHLLLGGGLLLAVRPEVRTPPVRGWLLNVESPKSFGPPEGTLAGPRLSAAKPSVRLHRPPRRTPHPLAEAEGLPPAPLEGTPESGPTAETEAAASKGDVSGVKAVAASAGGAGPASTETGPGGLSLARLGELHRRLAEAAERCYPNAARRFRLRGEVPLHFCLNAQGAATALSLEGSTGSPLLDRSALECVVPGAQPLSGFEGCFLVPVRFGG